MNLSEQNSSGTVTRLSGLLNPRVTSIQNDWNNQVRIPGHVSRKDVNTA